jgi:hypothetical protein
MPPVQDYQPRIRFRLDDAVTVLKSIEHVDNQQLGNFSQMDMENIVNAKVQKLEAAFTAQMQTLLATQQKTAQNFTTAPSCYALLRMRPLSISWAGCYVVISCGKVDYDKSGKRGD